MTTADRRPATLGHLRAMEARLRRDLASKDDLKAFATKDDLKSFATKDDFHRLAREVVKIQGDLRDVKDNMATKKEILRLITTVESFAAGTADNRRTLLVYDKTLGEHRVRLDTHDRRLTSLESRA